MSRGYYTRTVIVGLTTSATAPCTGGGPSTPTAPASAYAGQGNHSLTVGDVDADGRDEIVFGAMTIDDNGAPLWNTGLGHGDAVHLGDLDPARPGLEVFKVHEDASKPAVLVRRRPHRPGALVDRAGRRQRARRRRRHLRRQPRRRVLVGRRRRAPLNAAAPTSAASRPVGQLRHLVGRRPGPRAARPDPDRQVRHRRRHPPAHRLRQWPVQQRHQGHPGPGRRHPRRLARGGDLADRPTARRCGSTRPRRRPTAGSTR